MTKALTPEKAKEITALKQAEANGLRDRAEKVLASLMSLQRENNFAPRMALAYRRDVK